MLFISIIKNFISVKHDKTCQNKFTLPNQNVTLMISNKTSSSGHQQMQYKNYTKFMIIRYMQTDVQKRKQHD